MKKAGKLEQDIKMAVKHGIAAQREEKYGRNKKG